ncbi:Hypothetical predicted protein [Paramuricea clavata]|uniref:Uncharacterized protein n=1 Tax=Paramuricea clavata TaxID=317549 RepID=A0A6S7GMY8_PARCT|nr:Hypothetical predicted protein [Paramuricea clavata]
MGHRFCIESTPKEQASWRLLLVVGSNFIQGTTGTKLGLWPFNLMIKDLDIASQWKFVKDTATSEIIEKGHVSNAQSLINACSTKLGAFIAFHVASSTGQIIINNLLKNYES